MTGFRVIFAPKLQSQLMGIDPIHRNGSCDVVGAIVRYDLLKSHLLRQKELQSQSHRKTSVDVSGCSHGAIAIAIYSKYLVWLSQWHIH